MNAPMKRPSTFEEILSGLAAAGKPVTVGDALMVMVEEMNACLGTNIKATKRDLCPQTDAERRADIERTLALMDELRRRFGGPPDGARGGDELSAILERCRLAGIRLRAEGTDLQCDAPKGALTPELVASLKANKPTILAELAAQAELPRFRGAVVIYMDGTKVAHRLQEGRTEAEWMHTLWRAGAGISGVLMEDAVVTAEALTAADDAGLLWRVRITEPGGRIVEVDAPSGWTLAEWEAYATRYHGAGCAVTPIAGLPQPRAPANLDEALAAACEDVAGIAPVQFRALLSPEDVADIEAGDIGVETLKAYAASSGRRR